jgi:GNAT superfamily N-acetyltransferase
MVSSRRLEPMTADAVGDLPDPCRRCLFWELGAPRPELHRRAGPRRGNGSGASAEDDESLVHKGEWVAERSLETGPPGRLIRLDGAVVAYAMFAPKPAFAPRAASSPRVSPDALLLAALWVDPVHREVGLGRLLIQAALREAIKLDLAGVEAFGDRRWREQDCVLPATWLLHEGFEVHREHPRYPLFRIDTKRTSRWADTLEHALEEILEKVPRPARAPAPQRPVSSISADE